jgi:hypothetical protein
MDAAGPDHAVDPLDYRLFLPDIGQEFGIRPPIGAPSAG